MDALLDGKDADQQSRVLAPLRGDPAGRCLALYSRFYAPAVVCPVIGQPFGRHGAYR